MSQKGFSRSISNDSWGDQLIGEASFGFCWLLNQGNWNNKKLEVKINKPRVLRNILGIVGGKFNGRCKEDVRC